jgi:hypothetical protein
MILPGSIPLMLLVRRTRAILRLGRVRRVSTGRGPATGRRRGGVGRCRTGVLRLSVLSSVLWLGAAVGRTVCSRDRGRGAVVLLRGARRAARRGGIRGLAVGLLRVAAGRGGVALAVRWSVAGWGAVLGRVLVVWGLVGGRAALVGRDGCGLARLRGRLVRSWRGWCAVTACLARVGVTEVVLALPCCQRGV